MPDYGLLGGAEQMAFFFATAVDVLEVLVRVEVKLGGSYIRHVATSKS